MLAQDAVAQPSTDQTPHDWPRRCQPAKERNRNLHLVSKVYQLSHRIADEGKPPYEYSLLDAHQMVDLWLMMCLPISFFDTSHLVASQHLAVVSAEIPRSS